MNEKTDICNNKKRISFKKPVLDNTFIYEVNLKICLILY